MYDTYMIWIEALLCLHPLSTLIDWLITKQGLIECRLMLWYHDSCGIDELLYKPLVYSVGKGDFRPLSALKSLNRFCWKPAWGTIHHIPNLVSIRQHVWSKRTSDVTQYLVSFYHIMRFRITNDRKIIKVSLMSLN